MSISGILFIQALFLEGGGWGERLQFTQRSGEHGYKATCSLDLLTIQTSPPNKRPDDFRRNDEQRCE